MFSLPHVVPRRAVHVRAKSTLVYHHAAGGPIQKIYFRNLDCITGSRVIAEHHTCDKLRGVAFAVLDVVQRLNLTLRSAMKYETLTAFGLQGYALKLSMLQQYS
jgi:hypothetical protein